jgi:hypothetical protein
MLIFEFLSFQFWYIGEFIILVRIHKDISNILDYFFRNGDGIHKAEPVL